MKSHWVAALLAVWLGLAAYTPVSSQHLQGSLSERREQRALLQLIRLHRNESVSPCEEDRSNRDTTYLEVRRGDSFRHPRSQAGSGGYFSVLEVLPSGDVLLGLPLELHVSGEYSKDLDEETLRVSMQPIPVTPRQMEPTSDILELMVRDSVPPDAVTGFRPLPRPVAMERAMPRVVEGDMPGVPAGYRGRLGSVRLRVHLDADGEFERAEVIGHVSRDLDRVAVAAVSHWRYALGTPCRGWVAPRRLELSVEFAPKHE